MALAIKLSIPDQDAIDLQHLRRFAKPKFLPEHVLGKPDKVKQMYAVSRAWEHTPACVMQASSTTAWEWSTSVKGFRVSQPPTLPLMVCPTTAVDLKTLHDILLQHTPFTSSPESWAYPLEIKEITVPLLAPTSPEQAERWPLRLRG